MHCLARATCLSSNDIATGDGAKQKKHKIQPPQSIDLPGYAEFFRTFSPCSDLHVFYCQQFGMMVQVVRSLKNRSNTAFFDNNWRRQHIYYIKKGNMFALRIKDTEVCEGLASVNVFWLELFACLECVSHD
jgi:hypothetical protein